APTVTATYRGDEFHLASAGPGTTVTVTLPTTRTNKTTVSSSPNTVLAGVTSICTATVTDTSTSGATMPTGKITLSLATQYGGTLYGFCNLSGTGATATCTVPVALLVAFTSNIQASYPGDTTHSSSSGSTTLP